MAGAYYLQKTISVFVNNALFYIYEYICNKKFICMMKNNVILI